jgi:hypothetical protein
MVYAKCLLRRSTAGTPDTPIQVPFVMLCCGLFVCVCVLLMFENAKCLLCGSTAWIPTRPSRCGSAVGCVGATDVCERLLPSGHGVYAVCCTCAAAQCMHTSWSMQCVLRCDEEAYPTSTVRGPSKKSLRTGAV